MNSKKIDKKEITIVIDKNNFIINFLDSNLNKIISVGCYSQFIPSFRKKSKRSSIINSNKKISMGIDNDKCFICNTNKKTINIYQNRNDFNSHNSYNSILDLKDFLYIELKRSPIKRYLVSRGYNIKIMKTKEFLK